MNRLLPCLLFLALLYQSTSKEVTRIKRQFQPWNNAQNFFNPNGFRPSLIGTSTPGVLFNRPLTPDPATTTVGPLIFSRCTATCPATSEYNPVCGTDGQTYNNMGRLRCAQFCGKNVRPAASRSC